MSRINRRHFMQHAAGLSAMAAPSLAFLSRLKAAEETLKKKNKSLIVLWMSGGPTTLDLWDPKPDHANGGQFKPISTAASGVQVTEHLPNVAKQMNNLAIVRSLSTTEGDHNRGTSLMNTGRSPNPLVEFPSIGSVLAYQHSDSLGDLPAFITVGGMRSGPGFLGMKYAPFNINNPGQPPENVQPPRNIADARMQQRASLFSKIEKGFTASTGVEADAAQAHTEVYEKALNLVVSERKEVFLLDKEPASLREEYGNDQFGRGCLLARKLVEAGSVAVQVNLGGWDMHNNIFPSLHNMNGTGRLDILDRGMGALVRDLSDRGLLQDTVVVWMGEFGRTPRINQNAGRDHYPRAWSVVVGGGKIQGGQFFGSTDAGGEAVVDGRVTVNDLFATIYSGLGLDPETQIRDNLGRPTAIAGDDAKPISQLLA